MPAELKVFISYRRADLGGLAETVVGRIYDRLIARYGEGNVFMDVTTIPPGVDFVDFLGDAVAQADVLLAVIGNQWAELMRARMGEEDDFVRIEIESALARNIPVIPLLVGGAPMPGAGDLPPSLAAVRRRNAYPVDVRRDFNSHMTGLIQALDEHYGGKAKPVPAVPAPRVPAAPPPAKSAPVMAEASPASEFTNGLGMEMVWCPPGKFLMGSPAAEEGRSDDEGQHEVTLTRGFWIARHPVTQGQWEKLMGNNPSHFKESGPYAPVETVSWEDCLAFCQKLSAKEGQPYTLPTEAQWEYACRAGTSGPYAGSSLDEIGWYGGNSGGKTPPVGQKKPNPWGLYDMHGNVLEWCLDWYGDYPKGAATDPTGPDQAGFRVFRGGSWFDGAGLCRSAYRYVARLLARNLLGFRPVRSVVQAGK